MLQRKHIKFYFPKNNLFYSFFSISFVSLHYNFLLFLLMAKKFFLNIDLCQEYNIIAISCHLQYYKLAYYINNLFGFNLKKISDLVFNDNANFNTLYFEDVDFYRIFYLVSNKSEKGFLFNQHRNIDYFLFVKSQITDKQKQSLINKIKQISNVLTAFEIELENVKGINDILIDIEEQINTSIKSN